MGLMKVGVISMKVIEQKGMYPKFPRSGKETRVTHYCPGCGHGIVNKLIAECCAEMGLQDETIFVDPVGCGVFTYYYWDAAHISAAHGRASAVATGACRARPHAVTIAYQGDGDLGAIGFNNAFQAASRGENFACIFINNSLYGMTGGQMAPTTLEGEKTTTTPFGRDPSVTGHPLHVCEVFGQLQAPVYIARTSVADTKRILQTKQAIRRVFELQKAHRGCCVLEILAPCPTNFRMDPLKAAQFCLNEMEREFPLGTFRDAEKGLGAPVAAAAPAPQLDVIAQAAQGVDIAVDAFALGKDVLLFQQLHQLRHIEQVVFVGLLFQNAQKGQKLGFLAFLLGHGSTSRRCERVTRLYFTNCNFTLCKIPKKTREKHT